MSEAYVWHSTGIGTGYYENVVTTFDEKCIPTTGPGFHGPYVTACSTGEGHDT